MDKKPGPEGLAKEKIPCEICGKPCALPLDEIPADRLCPVCRYSMAPEVHRLHGVAFLTGALLDDVKACAHALKDNEEGGRSGPPWITEEAKAARRVLMALEEIKLAQG